MLAAVNVMEQADFEAWIAAESGPPEGATSEAEEIELGRELSKVNGCLKCHRVDGSESDGPTWLDLYGSEEELNDGTTVIVDDEYLRRSIS